MTMTMTMTSPRVAARAPRTHISRPSLRLLGTEPLRAAMEYASYHIKGRRQAFASPVGDSHPVIIFPGLASSGAAVAPLRRFCQSLGYTASDWGRGYNTGPGSDLTRWMAELADHTARLLEPHKAPATLIGWSLGGLYAREMAKEMPDISRCVVTLGTPFTGHPRATNAWRFYQMVSGQNVHDPALIERIRGTPTVPTTSIYSRTDGVVAWQCSINEEAPQAENIEVHASHIGMGMNPLALYAIADRLRQDPARWRRFDTRGARRWFYKTTGHAPTLSAGGY